VDKQNRTETEYKQSCKE